FTRPDAACFEQLLGGGNGGARDHDADCIPGDLQGGGTRVASTPGACFKPANERGDTTSAMAPASAATQPSCRSTCSPSRSTSWRRRPVEATAEQVDRRGRSAHGR